MSDGNNEFGRMLLALRQAEPQIDLATGLFTRMYARYQGFPQVQSLGRGVQEHTLARELLLGLLELVVQTGRSDPEVLRAIAALTQILLATNQLNMNRLADFLALHPTVLSDADVRSLQALIPGIQAFWQRFTPLATAVIQQINARSSIP